MRRLCTTLATACFLPLAAAAQEPVAPVEPVPAEAVPAPESVPAPVTDASNEPSATTLAAPEPGVAAEASTNDAAFVPPASSEPTAVAYGEPAVEASSPEEAARPIAFEGSLEASLLSRRFRYEEDVNDYLTEYGLGAGFGFGVDLRWFPGASFTDGIGSAFGVEARYERSLGISSEGDDATYDTVARTYEILALGRYVRDRLELVGQFGYGNHAFVFENVEPATNLVDPSPDVPGVTYSYLRIGAEVRAMFSEHVGVRGGLAYLAVLDPGGVGSSAWFPNARAGGTSLSAQLIYALPHRVELRAGLTYRRYFLDMRSQLGDPYVAGGAVDHHVALSVGAAYRY